MRRSKRHFDDDLSRVLAGEDMPESGDDLARLVSLLRSERPIHEPRKDLAATLASEAKHTAGAPGPAISGGPKPLPTRWRRRAMLSTFLSSLLGKMAIGAVALATTTGGLAASGNLPDGAQDWAAEQLGSIGVEIPHSEDGDREDDDVLGVINDEFEDGDVDDGEEFGEDVAGKASDGDSSAGIDTSGQERETQDETNGEDYDADVADSYEDQADGANS